MSTTERPLRLLVVDDELLIRWSIGETFAARGYEVVQAADAASARRTLDEQTQRPDAVVLDYRLPDSEGLTLLDDLRRAIPGRPIFLITADATPELVARALAHGATAVLSKPFDLSELEATVAAACRPRVH